MPYRPHHRYCALAAAIMSALASPSLHAQEQDGEALDSLTVYGSTYRNTATKTRLTPQETPQGISVIDEQTLLERNADSVATALRYASGVNTQLRGGAVNRLDLFSIRGFINYQNFYDGLQLIYNDWNLQPQIDMQAVQQVEVFKGPTSTLYGAMPPGGMVNLISKKPTTEQYNSVELTAGSHDLRELSFDSSGQLGDSNLSYRVTGLGSSSDGQAETSENERLMLAPSLDWQVSDSTLVNLNIYYQKDPDMGIYTTLPAAGLFQPNVNGKLDPDAFSGDENWNTYEREVLMAGYKIQHDFNDNWQFLQNARFQRGDAYQRNTYGTTLDADQRTYNRRAYLTDETSEGFTIDNQLSGLVQTGAIEHNLLVGVDYLQFESDIGYEDAAAPSIDLYNPDHSQINAGLLDFAASGYSSDFTIEKRQTGVYLQDQMRIGQWVLIAGGRHDRYEAKEYGVKYGAAVDNDLKQSNTSWRAGALYLFDNGLAPFVSYAESFEPVAGSDRLGRTYEPSTAEQWEAGLKFNPDGGRTNGSVTAYRILKDNVLTRDPNGSAYDQIQAGQVRSQGVELEVSSRLTDSFKVDASYTRQDVEVTRDNSGLEGKTPVWVPEQMASLWLTYDIYAGLLNGLSINGGVRYLGEAEVDALNSDEVPDVTLVDLGLSYDLGVAAQNLSGATLRMSVSNLFDERYYSCYDTLNCWFGAERSLQTSVRYDF